MTWIKLDRGLIDNPIFAHPIALKIWIWCLLKANYEQKGVPVKTGRGKTIARINPGQFIFGRFTAEDALNIDGSTIYKWIKKFASKEFEMITIKSNSHYSVVTICNWGLYQSRDKDVTPKEQPSNRQVPTKEQPSNTDKKGKEVKELKEDNIYPFEKFWELYDKKVGSKEKLIRKWDKLTVETKKLILKHIPLYKIATPDKQFRKNPDTFLNNKGWEDEIIVPAEQAEQKITDPAHEMIDDPPDDTDYVKEYEKFDKDRKAKK